jgi:hypothetical protein
MMTERIAGQPDLDAFASAYLVSVPRWIRIRFDSRGEGYVGINGNFDRTCSISDC